MAGENDQNNQNNQQKNKGGGGGGVSGIQYGGKLDPAQMRTEDSLGQLITDQVIVATTVVASTVLMYMITKKVRSMFGVTDKPVLQQQNGPLNAGQIIGALHNLKKNNPGELARIGANNPEILKLMTPEAKVAEKPTIEVTPS